MKSTFLILSAAVFFNTQALAQDNYSLWPRRPAEIEQAQRLIRQQEYSKAIELLTPFVHKRGLTGHEARHLLGAIRTRRYLSSQHPRSHIHIVRRGENIERIASANKSSGDLIMLINSMVEPSNLKVGQKVLIIPQDLRAELHLGDREISVWDGQSLVAAYDITPSQELLASGSANEETKLKDREGDLNGTRIPRSTPLFTSCNRLLRLANGITLSGAEGTPKNNTVQMKQRDLNELSLLLGMGARVSIVRQEKSFDPFSTSGKATDKSPAANK